MSDCKFDWQLIHRLLQQLSNPVVPPEVQQEADGVHQARNEVAYGGVDNPLIEWTISDDWTEIPIGRSQDAVDGELELPS